MATWDGPDCLAQLRFAIGRPSTDEALTDAQGYRLLSDAQDVVTEELAAHVPWLNYGAPELMTTADSKVYTVLYDALGQIEVYPTLSGQPLRCGAFWDTTADFAQEGTKTIRITGNRTRTFASGPYARYVRAELPLISASQAPLLEPDRARRLIVFRAAVFWARRGGRRDPKPFQDEYTEAFTAFITAEKSKFFGQGGEAYSAGGTGWWSSADLGG